MANIVEVRNLKLGEGIPKICVPLVGKTNEEILEEAKFLKNVKFDLIEWRVDHYENVENLEKVKEIVKALREEVGETVILFTFRSKKEGGETHNPKQTSANNNPEQEPKKTTGNQKGGSAKKSQQETGPVHDDPGAFDMSIYENGFTNLDLSDELPYD